MNFDFLVEAHHVIEIIFVVLAYRAKAPLEIRITWAP